MGLARVKTSAHPRILINGIQIPWDLKSCGLDFVSLRRGGMRIHIGYVWAPWESGNSHSSGVATYL